MDSYPTGQSLQRALAFTMTAGPPHLPFLIWQEEDQMRYLNAYMKAIVVKWKGARKANSDSATEPVHAVDDESCKNLALGFPSSCCTLLSRTCILPYVQQPHRHWTREARPGDIIRILFGGSVPFLLRPLAQGYKLVGACYVHGVMKGELIEQWRAGEIKDEVFTLC